MQANQVLALSAYQTINLFWANPLKTDGKYSGFTLLRITLLNGTYNLHITYYKYLVQGLSKEFETKGATHLLHRMSSRG